MGTGKTEVSRELSRVLGWKVIDLDDEIEKAQGMEINTIFSTLGEPAFREIETGIIRRIADNRGVIISTGGGVVLREENMDLLRRQGVIVCLTATPETIFKRTGHSTNRPLLKVDDPLRKIRELLEFRQPFYDRADIMIDTEGKTPLQIAGEILERVRWKG